MKLEYKSSSNLITEDFFIEGYASVFNVVDSYRDIILKGAFSKSIEKNNQNNYIKLLWQHDMTWPVGIINNLYEDEKGLRIKAQINDQIFLGKEIINLIKQGAIKDLSIGFKVIDSYYDNIKEIRFITEIELWEISLVTFPANEQANLIKPYNLEKSLNYTFKLIKKYEEECNQILQRK